MMFGVELCTAAGSPEHYFAHESLVISYSAETDIVSISLELDGSALVAHQESRDIITETGQDNLSDALRKLTALVLELDSSQSNAMGDKVHIRVLPPNAIITLNDRVWGHFEVKEWTYVRSSCNAALR
ncbi:MAG: hypothetical protein ACLFRR_06065 [Spirochaetaceae bacterium]